MSDRQILFLQLYIIAAVAVFHLVGTALYLYWMFWWYDILVHFFASIWVALAAVWIARHLGVSRTWLWSLCAVLLVSIGWELFEYVIKETGGHGFALDTLIDVIMNLLGGTVGTYIAGRGQ